MSARYLDTKNWNQIKCTLSLRLSFFYEERVVLRCSKATALRLAMVTRFQRRSLFTDLRKSVLIIHQIVRYECQGCRDRIRRTIELHLPNAGGPPRGAQARGSPFHINPLVVRGQFCFGCWYGDSTHRYVIRILLLSIHSNSARQLQLSISPSQHLNSRNFRRRNSIDVFVFSS